MLKEDIKKLLNTEIKCAIKCKNGCTRECEKCESYDETKQKDIEDMFYELSMSLNELETFALQRWMCTMNQRDGKCNNEEDCANCRNAENNCDEMAMKFIKLRNIVDGLID